MVSSNSSSDIYKLCDHSQAKYLGHWLLISKTGIIVIIPAAWGCVRIMKKQHIYNAWPGQKVSSVNMGRNNTASLPSPPPHTLLLKGNGCERRRRSWSLIIYYTVNMKHRVFISMPNSVLPKGALFPITCAKFSTLNIFQSFSQNMYTTSN